MRYALIENAIVQCDNITQYLVLDCNLLHKGKDHFEYSDFTTIFNDIKSYIYKTSGNHELVISSLFYLIPCFVRELQTYLGKSIKIIPLYGLIGKDKLMEVYDNWTIETTNDEEDISFRVYQNGILSKIRDDIYMSSEARSSGLETINTINNYIEYSLEISELKEIDDYYPKYKSIIQNKNGFAIFSPYGDLKFYNEILPGINYLKSIGNLPFVERNIHASFSISFCSGNVSFDNSYQTWVLMEKNRGLSFIRTLGNSSKHASLSLLESVIEETKLLVLSSNLCFSKFYLDIERDYFRQLHVTIQSLDNKIIYKTLVF